MNDQARTTIISEKVANGRWGENTIAIIDQGESWPYAGRFWVYNGYGDPFSHETLESAQQQYALIKVGYES